MSYIPPDYLDESEHSSVADVELLTSEWESDSSESEGDVLPDVVKNPVPVHIVSRQEWGALPGKESRRFKYPSADVIYSYTETEECKTKEECMESMRAMQVQHMKEGLPDIRFNFVIGGDGLVYEGTGWHVKAPENKHYPSLGDRHVEMAHSGRRGDFPEKQNVDLINSLYDYGVERKLLAENAHKFLDYLWPTN